MFYHIFLSPQKKRNAFISNKQGMQEFIHELRNDLIFRILGSEKKSGKSQNLVEL